MQLTSQQGVLALRASSVSLVAVSSATPTSYTYCWRPFVQPESASERVITLRCYHGCCNCLSEQSREVLLILWCYSLAQQRVDSFVEAEPRLDPNLAHQFTFTSPAVQQASMAQNGEGDAEQP